MANSFDSIIDLYLESIFSTHFSRNPKPKRSTCWFYHCYSNTLRNPVRYPIEMKYIATYFSTRNDTCIFFFPPTPPFNRSKWAREEGKRKGITKKFEKRKGKKKGTNSRTILKVSKRIFREWVVKRRNERWLVILRSNEKALSRSRKRREEKTESDAGVRCVGSQGDLDCPLSDLWTDYFFVYSPRFKTITYCGEQRSDSLPWTFKTILFWSDPCGFLSPRSFEKKTSLSFFLEALEKEKKRSLSLGGLSSCFLSCQFASSNGEARQERRSGSEASGSSRVSFRRCGVSRKAWTSAKETEGCFERITTNSWRQKNDRRNPRLLLFLRFPRVELFLKFRNDDRATKSDEEISLLFFFSRRSKIGSKILETSFDFAIEIAVSE